MAPTRKQARTPRLSTHESLIRNLQHLAQVAQTLSNTILQPPPPNRNSEVDRQVSKHRPPTFSGEEDPTILEEWIRTFDKIFKAVGCPEGLQVETASFYLKHEADLWWAHNGPSYKQKPGFNWEALKEHLRERFYPSHIRAAIYEEFLHLKQGATPITEYYQQFLKLARLTPELVPTESTKIEKFMTGLDLESRKGPSPTQTKNSRRSLCQGIPATTNTERPTRNTSRAQEKNRRK
ncbi:PREDICTED: uncharacterized protein LOC109189822 [Ipomoea nil]|uniref:uncharacterized protein LOC109189822 n=1 Tax=Ipomoea nil TaxID=35883 RepID=UPI000900DB3F|nr:PREDICTED: uncharacterized protein LOC109189822 [Ipomoea nil]